MRSKRFSNRWEWRSRAERLCKPSTVPTRAPSPRSGRESCDRCDARHGMRRDTRTALVMILSAFMALSAASPAAYAALPIHVETQRPADFVDIKSVATSIQVDIRYSGYHNFIAHPV